MAFEERIYSKELFKNTLGKSFLGKLKSTSKARFGRIKLLVRNLGHESRGLNFQDDAIINGLVKEKGNFIVLIDYCAFVDLWPRN